jgi:hypothetical protein
MDIIYTMGFTNFEEQSVQIQIQAFNQVDPSPLLVDTTLVGSGDPLILESVDSDDDKTKVIKGRKLTIGFNSTDTDSVTIGNSADSFSDGDEEDFLVINTVGGVSAPFIGNLILDDNTEAFQPRPNPVRLFASEGLGTIKDIKLRDGSGNIPVGHFSIIEYISLCLRDLFPGQQIHVAMNLYEKQRYRKVSANFNITATNKFRIPYSELGFIINGDTIEITGSVSGNNGSYTVTGITVNGTTSIDIQVSTSTFVLETTEVWILRTNGHTFTDIFLDATTFETEVNERDDQFTVLNKILDAFGCFITFDDDGWYIIRWDEYDRITIGITILKFANFDAGDGTFQDYTNIDVNKIIAHDEDFQYTGHRLSNDNAVKRFQRRWKSVAHIYNFEQPREVPCNSAFLRGTVDDDVLPLKTYIPECWEILRGFGATSATPNSDLRIWVRYDVNDNESERYLVLTPQAASGGEINYARSQGIEIAEKDKFELSFDYSADSDNAINGAASITIGLGVLYGDDSSVWVLGDNATSPTDGVPEWKLSNVDLSVNRDVYQWFFSATSGSEDYTEFKNYSIIAPPAPVDGKFYIHLVAANQLGSAIDDFAIRYNNLTFTYIPLINGTYQKIKGQQDKVTGTNDSRKNIEHEMFIGEPGKKILKGALKKFDGTNYVLTETWNYYHDPTVLTDSKLAKHIVYQWWNQYRKTRTVIESDIQGIGTSPPGMIHRWSILHGGQETKKFMLTSFRNMDFRTCGWSGVFVETSSVNGDRDYSDPFEFRYLQE